MPRPKSRKEGIPRFEIGERVVWKSGDHWKMGTILCLGKNRKEAEDNLPQGYKIQYVSKKRDAEDQSKSLIYFVAADTPLFKPGFTAHSVPERHLQKYKESWYSKEQTMWEEYKTTDFFPLALVVAKAIHETPKDVPTSIKNALAKICPTI
jgi:hypothetical protein